jgi:hypothetical protein
MNMITLLSAPLPLAYSLLSPSLPEVAALALVLAAALLALVSAMAGTVNPKGNIWTLKL